MSRLRHLVGLTIIFILLLITISLDFDRLLFAQGDPTATPNINWVNEPNGVNVRGGPGLNYDLIGQLPVGTWVQPLARNRDGEWILIMYLNTQGWVQRDLVNWRLDTAALPRITLSNPTPIPRPLYYGASGGPTQTPNANWVDVGVEGAYVRSGPGQGYSSLGVLYTGDVIDPVARDTNADWVLFRFGNGYGWVRVDLVAWITGYESLPVVDEPELTPNFTAVPVNPTRIPRSPTPSNIPEPTASNTPEPTVTDTPLPPTATPSNTPEPTASNTPEPTVTDTPLPPSATTSNTPEPTATNTPLPPTATASNTPEPTATNTPLPPTATASNTPEPTASSTPEPTTTNTPLPPTASNTPKPTATNTPLPATASNTPEPTVTDTPLPPTATASNTPEPTATDTPTAVAIAAAGDSGGPSGSAEITTTEPPDSGGDSPLAQVIIGGLGMLAILYIGTYLMQSANVSRYREGFPLTTCPVCQRGTLHVEDRRYRILGIPQVRRVVRCDTCRSVMRHVGRHRWRYAVDGTANPELFEAYNGRVLTEVQLMKISPEYQGSPPQYIENDDSL